MKYLASLLFTLLVSMVILACHTSPHPQHPASTPSAPSPKPSPTDPAAITTTTDHIGSLETVRAAMEEFETPEVKRSLSDGNVIKLTGAKDRARWEGPALLKLYALGADSLEDPEYFDQAPTNSQRGTFVVQVVSSESPGQDPSYKVLEPEYKTPMGQLEGSSLACCYVGNSLGQSYVASLEEAVKLSFDKSVRKSAYTLLTPQLKLKLTYRYFFFVSEDNEGKGSLAYYPRR